MSYRTERIGKAKKQVFHNAEVTIKDGIGKWCGGLDPWVISSKSSAQ
ncbi:hypothetical protein [Alkalitalea saponilacus]|nr:hypothetical protein [Alkalitalea saponilacus]